MTLTANGFVRLAKVFLAKVSFLKVDSSLFTVLLKKCSYLGNKEGAEVCRSDHSIWDICNRMITNGFTQNVKSLFVKMKISCAEHIFLKWWTENEEGSSRLWKRNNAKISTAIHFQYTSAQWSPISLIKVTVFFSQRKASLVFFAGKLNFFGKYLSDKNKFFWGKPCFLISRICWWKTWSCKNSFLLEKQRL